MSDDSDPSSTVRLVDGQVVCVDPGDAIELLRIIAKANCRHTFRIMLDRVAHFTRRVRELNVDRAEAVIVIAAVDDPHGGPLADILMPGTDWDAIRARHQIPIARGLVLSRTTLAGGVELFDPDAAQKLRACPGLPVLVIDYGVAEVFDSDQIA